MSISEQICGCHSCHPLSCRTPRGTPLGNDENDKNDKNDKHDWTERRSESDEDDKNDGHDENHGACRLAGENRRVL